MADPLADDALGGPAVDAPAAEPDLARDAHARVADRAQRRGLAGAVGPEQRDHAAVRHLERDAAQHIRGAVRRIDAPQLEERGHAGAPRYARITSGCSCISAGVPSARVRPKSSATTRSDTRITKLR